VSLCCTVGYKGVTVMDDVKFEFNDKISLYAENDSERSIYFDDIILNKVIC